MDHLPEPLRNRSTSIHPGMEVECHNHALKTDLEATQEAMVLLSGIAAPALIVTTEVVANPPHRALVMLPSLESIDSILRKHLHHLQPNLGFQSLALTRPINQCLIILQDVLASIRLRARIPLFPPWKFLPIRLRDPTLLQHIGLGKPNRLLGLISPRNKVNSNLFNHPMTSLAV